MGLLKEFYTIFYPVMGDICVKKSEIPAGHFVIFERKGGGGYALYKLIFSDFSLWKFGKIGGAVALSN